MNSEKKSCDGNWILRLLLVVALLYTAVFSFQFSSCLAQTDRGQLSKSMQKECKRQVRLLQKEGWTVWGGLQSLGDAMASHYLALEQAGPGATMIEGHGTSDRQNTAMRKAKNNAAVQYASLKESRVESETTTSVVNEQATETSTHIHLEQNSRSATEQRVSHMLPTVSLWRTLGDGTYEVRTFFVVNHLEDE